MRGLRACYTDMLSYLAHQINDCKAPFYASEIYGQE